MEQDEKAEEESLMCEQNEIVSRLGDGVRGSQSLQAKMFLMCFSAVVIVAGEGSVRRG